MSYRLSIDTGGTFTDVSLINEKNGRNYIMKVPSTPEDPSKAIVDGWEKIIQHVGIETSDISFFIHGTTVATNTLLEHKGASTALITTKGFKDVIQIGRQARPELYDLRARKPKPLVSRDMRQEVSERIQFDGQIRETVDKEEVQQIIEKIKNEKIESIAVCLLNAYMNSAHEKQIKKVIEKEFPEAYISLSSEILPEQKEYERSSTTIINSYLMPKMHNYLYNLSTELKKNFFEKEIYIMQSNGGVIDVNTAKNIPARTILSGPAGGALIGEKLSRIANKKNVITFDMGGTSMDACLIEDGNFNLTTLSNINDMPIKLPMVEIHTIGAGGGSIAWVDVGGALRVGPKSSGATPGPVCYNRGGEEPTVTDANAVLNRLNPKFILGGEMKIDVESARKIIKRKIADPLGVSIEEAAEGVLKVVNMNMIRGIRRISVEKGHNPKDFSLIALGGAGPLNASDIARELGCSEVIIPKNPGIASSEGMLEANVQHDYVVPVIKTQHEVSLKYLKTIFEDLENKAIKKLKEEGFYNQSISLLYSLDLRYKGQSHDINIPFEEIDNNDDLTTIVDNFYEVYKKMYGFNPNLNDIELVNARLTSIGILPSLNNINKTKKDNNAVKPIEHRLVFFNGQYKETPIYDRKTLPSNKKVKGPAIIEQLDSTIVVTPEQEFSCDSQGNLIIRSIEYLI